MAFAPSEAPLQGLSSRRLGRLLAFAASASVSQGLMPDSQVLRSSPPDAFICHPGPIFLL